MITIMLLIPMLGILLFITALMLASIYQQHSLDALYKHKQSYYLALSAKAFFNDYYHAIPYYTAPVSGKHLYIATSTALKLNIHKHSIYLFKTEHQFFSIAILKDSRLILVFDYHIEKKQVIIDHVQAL